MTKPSMPISILHFRPPPSALRLRFSPLLIACLLASGCGGVDDGVPRVQVIGVVTVDGEPLEKGMVSFFPDESAAGAQSATGHIQPDGSYTLGTFEREDGAAPGQYRVAVQSYETDLMTGEDRPLIPERYFSVDESGLSAHVLDEPDDQTFNFDLQSQ